MQKERMPICLLHQHTCLNLTFLTVKAAVSSVEPFPVHIAVVFRCKCQKLFQPDVITIRDCYDRLCKSCGNPGSHLTLEQIRKPVFQKVSLVTDRNK